MTRKRPRLPHPLRVIDPQSLLIFTHSRWFERDWEGLGLSDFDLVALQLEIMLAPTAAPVIRRTGGLRKMRFSPPSWSIGKRGALRVCYCYYQRFGHVLLVVVYPKSERDTLSDEEADICRKLIEEHEQELERIYTRKRNS